MSKIKLIMCVVMTLVFCIMALGYAALQQRIDIQGEATVDSTYRVEITSVAEGSAIGDARSTNAPQYNGLTANFYVGLTNDTDYITYTVEITNYSTVDIILNELEITIDGSSNIKAQKSGIRNGDIMLAGSTKTMTLKVKYDGEQQVSEQTGTIILNFEFTRLKGGVGEVVVDNSYSIGDKVSFAGSDWYVIEDSPETQDYVVLLKQNLLTNSEMTSSYAYRSTNTMSYYWSETCHRDGYGYESNVWVTSGCTGHNDYEESKVKEMLETVYLPTIGANNLKIVNDYKIRLISLSEFTIIKNITNSASWLVNGRYWTMTPGNGSIVIYVSSNGEVAGNMSNYDSMSVRPVINLYKDAIE